MAWIRPWAGSLPRWVWLHDGSDDKKVRLVLVGGVAASVTLALAGLVAYRRYRERSYEYGDLDLVKMTPAIAKKIHQRVAAQRDSLIPDALQDLEESGAAVLADAMKPELEVDRRAEALAKVGAPPFRQHLKDVGLSEFKRCVCTTLQLNIGLYCNQACTHCHVESSPLRTEMMSTDVVERCLFLLAASPAVTCLDITGGAPELNSGFRQLVEGAVKLRDTGARPDLRIIDRCNLTVLLEPGQEDLLDFLVEKRVHIIASLPSYDAQQTNAQRGRRVFERSVEALKMLNKRGYGAEGAEGATQLRLDLVFNPPGPFLPPKQDQLEKKYREQLSTVKFNNLLTVTNMPVKRFFDFLRKKGMLEGYMDLLVRNFNEKTVPKLMCLDTVNVGWDGRIYDCDFNQQLELTLGGKPGLSVFDIDSLHDEKLQRTAIRTAAHCYGCTAAQGSS